VSGPTDRKRADARAWLRRHGYGLVSSIGTLVRNPLTSALTIVVLAIALALPLGLYTTLVNLDQLHREFDRLDTVSVFLELETDERGARRTASGFSTWPDIIAVDPISPDEGMQEMSGALPSDDFGFDDAPLPWVLEVAPRPGADIADLAGKLQRADGVDLVTVDLEWVRRFDAIVGLLSRLVQVLAVLFALAVLFVISNNIRTEIQRRNEEIEVLALVGATPSYIRRPFLYSGLWMGLLGAVAAWAIVHGGLWLLQGPVAELAASYGTPLDLASPPLAALALMLGVTGVLGVVGAWIAVTRQLALINP
jgi:cell division transport system permease protein